MVVGFGGIYVVLCRDYFFLALSLMLEGEGWRGERRNRGRKKEKLKDYAP